MLRPSRSHADQPAAIWLMPRPLLLRLLPEPLRERAWWRLYHARQVARPDLFLRATLAYAPGAAMYDLVVGDLISSCIAFTGLYERGLSRRIAAAAAEGGLFLDVGANQGYFSLIWAAARPDNRVLAFEASPRVLARLEGNIARNGFDERIVLVRAAASDAAGELSFLLGPEDQLGWGGIAAAGLPETECVTVAAVRVDEVVGDRSVAVMKIDVEGAEPLVLRGCRRLLERRQVGIVYYECNAVRLAALGFVAEDMHRELRQHGYRCQPLDAAGNEWVATPPD